MINFMHFKLIGQEIQQHNFARYLRRKWAEDEREKWKVDVLGTCFMSSFISTLLRDQCICYRLFMTMQFCNPLCQ